MAKAIIDDRITVGVHVRFWIQPYNKVKRIRLSGIVKEINYETGDVIIYQADNQSHFNRKFWQIKFYRF